jgi:hypothetical protein
VITERLGVGFDGSEEVECLLGFGHHRKHARCGVITRADDQCLLVAQLLDESGESPDSVGIVVSAFDIGVV